MVAYNMKTHRIPLLRADRGGTSCHCEERQRQAFPTHDPKLW